MKFSANKIYYNFSQENPKSTNIQNPHRPYKHFKHNTLWYIKRVCPLIDGIFWTLLPPTVHSFSRGVVNCGGIFMLTDEQHFSEFLQQRQELVPS